MSDRCEASVTGGQYICTRAPHDDPWHENRQRGALFASWHDDDCDDPPCACAHDSMTGADRGDGKLWRCDACGVVQREIRDPNGKTWVGGVGEEPYRVRYEVVS